MHGLASYIEDCIRDEAARNAARDNGGGIAHPGGDGKGGGDDSGDDAACAGSAGGSRGSDGGGHPDGDDGRRGGDSGGRTDGEGGGRKDDGGGYPDGDGGRPGGDGARPGRDERVRPDGDGGCPGVGSARPGGDHSGSADGPGHEPTGGALARAGVDAHSRRRLMDLSPAEQAAISMALVDVADGPGAACFAAGEAETARTPRVGSARGTPARADPSASGGPVGGVHAMSDAELDALIEGRGEGEGGPEQDERAADGGAGTGFRVTEFVDVAGVNVGPGEDDEMEDCEEDVGEKIDNGAAAGSGGRRTDGATAGGGGAAPGAAAAPPSGQTAGVTASGRGVAWAETERRVLCRAYRAIAQDPIVGTDQTGRTFWAAVSAEFRWRMSQAAPPRGRGCGVQKGPPPNGGGGLAARWPYRTTVAITKEMRDHIAKNVQLLASSFTAVDRANLTGNMTETDREVAAAAHFEGRNMYDAVRGDEEEAIDAASLPTDKRASTWMGCWRVLKSMDKFSGAAGAAGGRPVRGRPIKGGPRGRTGGHGAADGAAGRVAGAGAGGRGRPAASSADDGVLDDDEEEDGSVGAFQARPAGTKAAKARRAADLSLAREADATRAALDRMAGVAERRADIAFWGGPDVRRTPEAAQWRKLEMRRRLDALGWTPSASTLSAGEEPSEEDNAWLDGLVQAPPAATEAAAAAAAVTAANADDSGMVPSPPPHTLPLTVPTLPPTPPPTPALAVALPLRPASPVRVQDADFLEGLTPPSRDASPDGGVRVVGTSAPIRVTEVTDVIDLVESSEDGMEDEIEGVPLARPPSVGERRRSPPAAAVRGMDTKRRRFLDGQGA